MMTSRQHTGSADTGSAESFRSIMANHLCTISTAAGSTLPKGSFSQQICPSTRSDPRLESRTPITSLTCSKKTPVQLRCLSSRLHRCLYPICITINIIYVIFTGFSYCPNHFSFIAVSLQSHYSLITTLFQPTIFLLWQRYLLSRFVHPQQICHQYIFHWISSLQSYEGFSLPSPAC